MRLISGAGEGDQGGTTVRLICDYCRGFEERGRGAVALVSGWC